MIKMKAISDPLVSVCSLTYNHAAFFNKMLNGFFEQRTTFPMEIIIHDDASTDETQNLLQSFNKATSVPTKILYEEKNQFSQGVNIAFDIILPHVKGKYAAICEGDDWWISPNKLQRQISFMEAHPNCVLTVHNGIKVNAQTGESSRVDPFGFDHFLSEEEMYFSFMNNPPTASFVIRVDALRNPPDFLRRAPVFDDAVRLYCYEQGDVYYFHDLFSGRYFRHDGSWTRMLERDTQLFQNYTVRLLEYYHELDVYTNGRHAGVIQAACRKIGKRFYYTAGDKTSTPIVQKICYLAGIKPEAIL